MRSTLIFSAALAGLALAAPRPHPQDINLDAVDAAPDPTFVTPPVDVVQEVVTPGTTDSDDTVTRRALDVEKRDGTCAKQPAGSGIIPSPDTASAFSADTDLQAIAQNAYTPDGYTQVFVNLAGSLSASMYMGLYTLPSFDTLSCASLCDQAQGCSAFNMYIERDPSLDPNAASCPNPPSTTNYKCTLWGAPVCAQEATNLGQWRDSFQVVITGSNGYNKNAPPPSIPGFTGPTELGGAINAPLDASGKNTYITFKYYPFSQSQGYTPSTCASACTSQTAYNSRHPAADGTYVTCEFFNAYVLSENGVPQGLYCSLYTETWAPSYGTNYGQYRGSNRYTVSESYSYSLSS
ncbi:hypothetical protein MMC12_006304 [Toensbergia leucococca]|nr:hypothetical protein [Toensbergia leucococca]